ncbi:2-hydroxycarboxylate transporter family protein [Clostridium sp. SHJSY1]|uniref:2-hydroxycarboxylate transporter family protein n=1 Tax=Clostridium sp. SHJSY1 TaxID=2942483 RepID=UPI0028756A8B|nr:2-hydroxycarboxylate transporter family protein [Clostridium sp. SHJSY1]MDS0526487.1 2-hydroxycarboxylate transporter family protein [Clostridium sp. SHJSY1]
MDNTSVVKNTDVISTVKKIFGYKIAFMPLGVYLLLLVIVTGLLQKQIYPNDMIGSVAIMVLYGYGCAEIGQRIPLLKNVGGKVIMATFLPSYLLYANIIPKQASDAVIDFMENTNFLYVFIACIIVGSICSMNRQVLIKAFFKMFVPLVASAIAATVVGVAVGTLLGIGPYKTYFFIVAPIMAGGVGEGALPLSMGYASVLGQEQNALFASVLPCVMLGSLIAIIYAGILKRIGEKYPQFSGNGSLLKSGDSDVLEAAKAGNEAKKEIKIDLTKMAATGVLAFGLYLFGVYVNSIIGLPAPIVMLLSVVIAKAAGIIPDSIEKGGFALFKFITTAVTVPLLLGVGIAKTPWENLVAVITNPKYLIVIVCTVTTVVVTGWFVGKVLNMYPVEAAMVTSCNSGQGGTGDIAILTSGNRLELLPFAQVATRLGGAATVTIAIALLRMING